MPGLSRSDGDGLRRDRGGDDLGSRERRGREGSVDNRRKGDKGSNREGGKDRRGEREQRVVREVSGSRKDHKSGEKTKSDQAVNSGKLRSERGNDSRDRRSSNKGSGNDDSGLGYGGSYGGAYRGDDPWYAGYEDPNYPQHSPVFGRGGGGGWYHGGVGFGRGRGNANSTPVGSKWYKHEEGGFGRRNGGYRGGMSRFRGRTPNYRGNYTAGYGEGPSNHKDRNDGYVAGSTGQKGDSEGSGTANEILARRINELEQQLKGGTPKDKTLTELKDVNAKNLNLKGKVESLAKELSACKAELAEFTELQEVVNFFKKTVACENNGLDEILMNCSARVKKHMKVVIDDKLEKLDLQSCLKIVMSRMESHNIWAEILYLIKKMDSEDLRKELIYELGGSMAEKKDAKPDDSGPSCTDTEDDNFDLLKPKTLMFDQKVDENCLDKAPKVSVLADSDRERIKGRKKQAKEILKLKQKEALEEQAASDMATGDDTIIASYDELIHKVKLVGRAVLNDSSPIIKKRKASSKDGTGGKGSNLKKAKLGSDNIKTYSLGGVCIQTEGPCLFKMIDLINNAQEEGAKILDDATGDLVKKMPCGFYPNCVNALGKESIVIGGVIIQPPGHKRIDKLVYLCGDHKVDMLEVGVSEVNIKESGNAEVDPINVVEDAGRMLFNG